MNILSENIYWRMNDVMNAWSYQIFGYIWNDVDLKIIECISSVCVRIFHLSIP